jgi:predicted esterase
MATSMLDTTVRALRRGMLALSLTGLLAACAPSTSVDAADTSAESAPGGGAAATTDANGATTSSTEPQGGAGGGGATGTTSGSGSTSTSESGAGAGAPAGQGGGEPQGQGGGEPQGQGGGGAGGPGNPGAGAGNPGGIPKVQCVPIVQGAGSVIVNGIPRVFDVQLPADTSHMALMFMWHGWMQNPIEFANTAVYDVPGGSWVPFDPNAFPMPLMIVTPMDMKMVPPFGLDWDIVGGGSDFTFFEAMLGCIEQQFSIEKTRVYSFGFSAGAVFTNLLAAKYPHLLAATISESGAWFNDKAEWSDISVPIMQWKWPALDPADGGNVLITHGGQGDYATVISLEDANQKALPFLHAAGRTVTECWHTFGHTLDPDLTQQMYYDWLWAHTLGGPPLGGLPAGFPTPWSPVGATRCAFHPAP